MYTTTILNDAARMAAINAAACYNNAGLIPTNTGYPCTTLNNGLNTTSCVGFPLTQTQTLTTGQTVAGTNQYGQTVIGQIVVDACGTRLITNHGIYTVTNNLNTMPMTLGNVSLTPMSCVGTVTLIPQSVMGA